MENWTSTPNEVEISRLRISLGVYGQFVEVILEECFKMARKTIVTPNIGHLNALRTNDGYQNSMRHAFLSLPDGWPIAAIASLKAMRIQKRITGSDLIPILLSTQRDWVLNIAVLGLSNDNIKNFQNFLDANSHKVQIVFAHEMQPSIFRSESKLTEIANQLSQTSPNLVISCFGSPKQEIFNDRFLEGKNFGVAIGAGASLDFIVAKQKRSPLFFRKVGLEWLYRVFSNPRRLFLRYLIGIFEFLLLIANFLVGSKVRKF